MEGISVVVVVGGGGGGGGGSCGGVVRGEGGVRAVVVSQQGDE